MASVDMALQLLYIHAKKKCEFVFVVVTFSSLVCIGLRCDLH